MSRELRNTIHQKQNRMRLQKGIPNVDELSEGVPVLRSVSGIGIVEYIRYNGQLYSSAFSAQIPVSSNITSNISLLNDGKVGIEAFSNTGSIGNSVNQFLLVDVPFLIADADILAVDSGTTDSSSAYKLIQSGQNFSSTVASGDIVKNATDTTYAIVTEVDSDTQLSINRNIMATSEVFVIYRSGNLNDLSSLAAKVNEIIRVLRKANIIGEDGRYGDTHSV